MPDVDETSDTPPASPEAQAARPAAPDVSEDGRTSRSARTRSAVVEALLTLNERGNPRPTAKEIAAEAGVSSRSVYVHFDDMEALSLAASGRQWERLLAISPRPVTEGDLSTRLAAFVERRTLTLEFGANVRKAAVLQEPFSAVLRETLTQARRRLHTDVQRCFASELAMSPRPDTLATAIDIAASSATWETMRSHQGLSVEQASDQMRAMVEAYLECWTQGPERA